MSSRAPNPLGFPNIQSTPARSRKRVLTVAVDVVNPLALFQDEANRFSGDAGVSPVTSSWDWDGTIDHGSDANSSFEREVAREKARGKSVVAFPTFAKEFTERSGSESSGSNIGPLLMDEADVVRYGRVASSEGSTVIVTPRVPFEKDSDTSGKRSPDGYQTDGEVADYTFANESVSTKSIAEPADHDKVLLVLDNLDLSDERLVSRVAKSFAGEGNTSLDDGELADTEDTSISTNDASFDTSADANMRPSKLGRGDVLIFEAVGRIFTPTSVAGNMRRDAAAFLMIAPPVPPSTPTVEGSEG